MGVVVAAMNVDAERRVAVKLLLPAAAAHPEFVARFAREARAAAKITSEHGARVYDVGTLPSGLPFMVMEYLEGEDLKQLARRAGPLPIELAVDYVMQAAEAVAEAHVLGMVHRDLKPANLFLARQPNGQTLVKVLDFGIAKATQSAAEAQLTREAMMMGSPGYASPEQLTSAKSVDARSDIWSLGVILYELVSGVKPFQADTMPEVVRAILERAHEPLHWLRTDVPPALEAAVHRCLEKDPAKRFQTIAELAAALVAFAPSRSGVSVERIAHLYRAQVSGFPPAPSGRAAPPDASVTAGVLAGVLSILVMPAIGVLLSTSRVYRAPVVAETEFHDPAPTPSPPSASVAARPAPTVVEAPGGDALVAAAPDASIESRAPSTRATAAAAPAALHNRPPACRMASYVDGEGNKRFKQVCQGR